MALADLHALDGFAAAGFAADWPADRRVFFSPVDDVHGALKACLASSTESLAIAMYGYDDSELADIVRTKLEAEHVAVQLTLDSSQAGGVHEKALLAQEAYPNSVIAVGRSEKGAISHQKIAVIDGILTVSGSTNWSAGGEEKQDNELEIHLDRAWAARYRARADAIHAHMLQRAGGRQ